MTARAHIEHESRFGCGMGGNATYYVDSSGNVQPCVFTQMAVGNVNDEELSVILQRMRGMFTKVIGGPCPVHEVSKPIAAAIEGGASNPVGCATTEVLAAKLMERDEPEVTRKLSRQLPIVRGH